MKISEFANRFNVNNDTIRYYMKLNLITPKKKGGHYQFDDECINDMEQIIKLKKMDFSLKEIKEIFHFIRLGKVSSYKTNKYYQNIYKEKIKEVDSKIEMLKNANLKLNKELSNLKKTNVKKSKIGIDLSVLNIFSCPICGGELKVSAEKVEENQIFDGKLICKCGKKLAIKDGILYTEDFFAEEEIDESFIEDYIIETDKEFIDELYKSLDWLKNQLNINNFKDKVILEPGTGMGLFLRQIYNDLPEDAIYICVDNRPEMNKFLKKTLENNDKNSKIIFITAHLPVLPLKKNIVDIVIDCSGTSGFSFNNKEFLIKLIDKYFKLEIDYYGAFIIYHKFGENNVVKKEFRKNFILSNIKNNLSSLSLKINNENKSRIDTIKESPGKYEEFAQPGDKIYSFEVVAKRWS